jgi:nucleoside 2-deoxyribosyltransferase
MFNSNDLIGNLYLAIAIHQCSRGKYACILPQDLEQRNANPKAIKDNDLRNVRDLDGAVFSFDGSDPESGTVVEFVQAKSLGKPVVLVRSDLRAGGDQHRLNGDPWNLMMSNYPRTQNVVFDGIVAKYQELRLQHRGDVHQIAVDLSKDMAHNIVAALDKAFAAPPLPLPGELRTEDLYAWYNVFNNL